MSAKDTIAAPITASGRSAVAAVRVSGPAVPDLIKMLSPKAEQILSAPRTAVLSPVWDLAGGAPPEARPVLDYGLFLYFRSPASYTGEEVVEINLHGGTYLVRALMQSLAAAGIRPARPGEFTERAFHSGKVDLVQAEAIADLIGAETAAQARVAREQLEGRLSGALSDLGEPLRDLVAEIEARIDFPEEGIEPTAIGGWVDALIKIEESLGRYLSTYRFGKIQRDGAAVALIGAPNSGKSSLLNRLLGEERAIVTPIPGTTRDTIEERIELDGVFVRLFDTAGLDTGGRELDPVEKLGIERSWSKARNADLILLLVDGEKWAKNGCKVDAGDQAILSDLGGAEAVIRPVATKADLISNAADAARTAARLSQSISDWSGKIPLLISSMTGQGIDDLRQALAEEIASLSAGSGQVFICAQRHFEALTAAKNSVAQARQGLIEALPAELVSLDLRSALSCLNEIVGVTPNEDILGRIFSRFCIGK